MLYATELKIGERYELLDQVHRTEGSKSVGRQAIYSVVFSTFYHAFNTTVEAYVTFLDYRILGQPDWQVSTRPSCIMTITTNLIVPKNLYSPKHIPVEEMSPLIQKHSRR